MDSINVMRGESVSVHAAVGDGFIALAVSALGEPGVAPAVALSVSDSRKLREMLEAAEAKAL